MFVCVGLFGLFTIVFGVSTTVWLSVARARADGAADMVSVYVRETLIQLWTPDAVRGRVNAVNMVFVGASNELGEFRAGTVAALIGVVPAVSSAASARSPSPACGWCCSRLSATPAISTGGADPCHSLRFAARSTHARMPPPGMQARERRR